MSDGYLYCRRCGSEKKDWVAILCGSHTSMTSKELSATGNPTRSSAPSQRRLLGK